MNTLRLSSLMLGLLGGVLLANCSPTPSCTSATCGGCCDATGKCQSGASVDACGVNGETCGRCGSGTVCARGECEASSGTGGGGGGGGGGASGGGAGGGCRQLGTITTPTPNELVIEYRAFSSNTGFYNFALWGVGAFVPYNAVRVEVVYPNVGVVPMPPLTQSFAAVGYRSCSVCALFHESCDEMGVCARSYLAQAGTITIDRADRSPAGRIVGSAANVRFNEWDIDNDRAVGTECVEATFIGPWNSGWNADGGAAPP